MADKDLIILCRKVLNVTQKTFSLNLNCSRYKVRQWESGARTLTPETIRKILELVTNNIVKVGGRQAFIFRLAQKWK